MSEDKLIKIWQVSVINLNVKAQLQCEVMHQTVHKKLYFEMFTGYLQVTGQGVSEMEQSISMKCIATLSFLSRNV